MGGRIITEGPAPRKARAPGRGGLRGAAGVCYNFTLWRVDDTGILGQNRDEKARALRGIERPPRPYRIRDRWMWVGRVVALFMVVALAGGGVSYAELVSAKVTADEVEFSYDRRYVTLTGNARIFGQVVSDPARYVRMRANFIEGDLQTGRFELLGDVEIITPDGALSGEAVQYNMRTAEYSLRRGGVMLPIENAAGERVWGFAYAREINAEDHVIYITDGRFTTCDRPDPDYVVEVDRIRYDPETMDIAIWGGTLCLYDTRIPLLPKITWNFTGQPDKISPLYWFIPTYSSRDGIRLSWTRGMRQLEMPCDGYVGVKLTQRRGIRGEIRAFQDLNDELSWRLNVTYKEDVAADLDRQVTIDRLPEVALSGVWDEFGWDSRLEAAVTVGQYTERAEGDLPDDVDTTHNRLQLSARYLANPAGRDGHRGAWWWVGGSQTWYDDEQQYGWLEAGVGGGTDVTPWLKVWAEINHHVIDGTTPFQFDDIDIETELSGLTSIRLSPLWTVNLGGRYDLDVGELRDYTVELRRRDHCLTWTAQYHDVTSSFGIGLEINGIFGNFEPATTRRPEDGVPRFWEYIDGMDMLRSMFDDEEVTSDEMTVTSGARETP